MYLHVNIPCISCNSGVVSSGTMASVGAIATAGLSYYEARKGKKHQKYQSTAAKRGMSLDAYMHQTNAKDAKKVSHKAKKLGLTPEQYMAKRAQDYNIKMTNKYGPFNGILPAGGKHKKGKKNKKGKRKDSGSSSSSSGSGSSGSESN